MKRITITLFVLFVSIFSYAQTMKSTLDVGPKGPQMNSAKGAWTMQFNHSMNDAGSAGCETDGTYFYITKWSGDLIWKYDMNGIKVDSFTVAGVSGLRDLAYDGQYFYGGASSNTIYKMDFSTTPPTKVGTINSPNVTVRNICYDPNADNGAGGFWVGNWSTDLSLVSRTGTVLSTIPSTTHDLHSTYGTAYDTISAGGPYIWAISSGNPANATIFQIKVSTGAKTGVSHDVSGDVPGAVSGGGLWIETGIIAGTTTLGGLIQGTAIIGYDLASTTLDSIEVELASINNLQSIQSSAASSVDIIGTIINNGSQDITSYDVTYTIDNGTAVAPFTVNPTSPIPSLGTDSFTHNVPANLSVLGTHDIKVIISNINGGTIADADTSNNHLTKTITTISQFIQKKVLHEVLTSSTCGPCAGANPVIDGVVYNNNETKATLIKYQVSWPGTGDPYQNAESAARVTYYGTNGVPDFKVDGNNTESGTTYTQAKLDAYASNSAVATVTGTATMTGTTVNVNVNYDAISDISGTLVAQIAVIEKKTVLNVASNGETEFHNVMMKFIPSPAGSSLNDFATPYTTQNITLSQDLTGTNVEWIGNLRVIAWLQDNADKKVYQSEYIDITSTAADAGVTEISTVATGCGLPASNDVTFTVYNGGFTDLTDVEVSYTVGGGAAQTATVTGTITPGSTGTVTVTGIDFSAVGSYDIVASTNVTNDAWTSNDSTTYHLSNVAPATVPYAEPFTAQTLGWKVLDANSDGKTWRYATGTNYGHGDNTAYLSNWNATLPADDYLYSTCIDLTANTTYNLSFWYHMGIDNGTPYPEKLKVLIGTSADVASMTQTIVDLGQFSNGTYEESSTNFTVPTSGTYYVGFHSYSDANMWYTALDDVKITIATGINPTTNSNFNIYPNPTTGIFVIEGAKDSEISVYNMIGDVIYTNNNSDEITTIDLSSFSIGNYIVKIVNNNEVSYQKIILTK